MDINSNVQLISLYEPGVVAVSVQEEVRISRWTAVYVPIVSSAGENPFIPRCSVWIMAEPHTVLPYFHKNVLEDILKPKFMILSY